MNKIICNENNGKGGCFSLVRKESSEDMILELRPEWCKGASDVHTDLREDYSGQKGHSAESP